MVMTIRDATASDIDTIANFNSRMAVETESRSLDRNIIGPGVARLIDDNSKGRYWVADLGWPAHRANHGDLRVE